MSTYTITASQNIDALTSKAGGGWLTTEQAEQLIRVDTAVALNLDKKVSEVGGWGGWFVNYEAINSHTTRKVNEAKEEIEKKISKIPQVSLENIETTLSEIDSHNSLATEEIINTIKSESNEVSIDIIRKTKELKEDNVKTRNLVRQKTEKINKKLDKDEKDEQEGGEVLELIKEMKEDQEDRDALDFLDKIEEKDLETLLT